MVLVESRYVYFPSETIHIIQFKSKLYRGIICVGIRSESERGKEKKRKTEREGEE